MPHNQNYEDIDLDLGELFAAVWAQKTVITLIIGICVYTAGYYVLSAKKVFTASAIFQIEDNNFNSKLSISKEMGALASLAGITGASGSSSLETLLDRANGREFILNFKDKYSIHLDPYFNSYDFNGQDPFWKEALKKLIGVQKTLREKNAIVESNVIRHFRKNIGFMKTKHGTITISVTHVDPQKASNYANYIMEEIKLLVETESDTAKKLQLNYLSETLADALQEMENAEKNLKNYALENSTLAQENFISDSLKLDQIRMERRKVIEIAELLSIIENLVKSGNLDNSSYEALRSSHPLVDDIDFRRILGMSETISAWTWPEIETINAIRTTLRDRIKRLNADIDIIEEKAKIYATSAEDLAKLTREAKIAEATYIVLIEQVKSQSLAAGFQPENFKVFEYATPPIVPSSPNRNFVLSLGAVIGIFLGVALALINSKRRGVYNTKSSLISDASADLSLKSNSIRRLPRESIAKTTSYISERKVLELDQAFLKLSNKKIVYVINFGGRPSAANTAQLLATKSAQSGRNVVLCDTTGHSNKEIKNSSYPAASKLPVAVVDDNMSILASNDIPNFFTAKNFNSTIKDLIKQFDQVFICSSVENTQLGLMALTDFLPGLVVVVRLRRTKS